jgi:hypothetical protein
MFLRQEESLFIENYFRALEMAYLRGKRKLETWPLTTGSAWNLAIIE